MGTATDDVNLQRSRPRESAFKRLNEVNGVDRGQVSTARQAVNRGRGGLIKSVGTCGCGRENNAPCELGKVGIGNW